MRYIIWDFDGTIAERDGLWSGTLVEAAALEGAAIHPETLRPFLQTGFPWHSPDTTREPHIDASGWWRILESVFTRAYVQGGGLDEHRAARIACRVREIYLAPQRWRLFPDFESSVGELSTRGWHHLILSNHVPELPDLVASLGIAAHFDAIFSSGTIGIEKPNPAAFQTVVEYAGPGAELLMIGDSWATDIRGAARLGIMGILVRRPHCDAEYYCDSLSELHNLRLCR